MDIIIKLDKGLDIIKFFEYSLDFICWDVGIDYHTQQIIFHDDLNGLLNGYFGGALIE